MKIEEMMKEFTGKYVGELEKDYVRDVDCEFAKTKFLTNEYLDEICMGVDALKSILKGYFDTERAEMYEKSMKYALDANNMAHDLVHDILVLWSITETLIPKD